MLQKYHQVKTAKSDLNLRNTSHSTFFFSIFKFSTLSFTVPHLSSWSVSSSLLLLSREVHRTRFFSTHPIPSPFSTPVQFFFHKLEPIRKIYIRTSNPSSQVSILQYNIFIEYLHVLFLLSWNVTTYLKPSYFSNPEQNLFEWTRIDSKNIFSNIESSLSSFNSSIQHLYRIFTREYSSFSLEM